MVFGAGSLSAAMEQSQPLHAFSLGIKKGGFREDGVCAADGTAFKAAICRTQNNSTITSSQRNRFIAQRLRGKTLIKDREMAASSRPNLAAGWNWPLAEESRSRPRFRNTASDRPPPALLPRKVAGSSGGSLPGSSPGTRTPRMGQTCHQHQAPSASPGLFSFHTLIKLILALNLTFNGTEGSKAPICIFLDLMRW